MTAADMPINMGMNEDTPLSTDNQVTESEAIVNENADSEMTEADVANSINEHDSFPNSITFNWLPPRSMNSFDEMALEFRCLLDEAKTARLYQRKIAKLHYSANFAIGDINLFIMLPSKFCSPTTKKCQPGLFYLTLNQ
ncbi:hypothetical protein A0J61_11889 [Choanephora cucurbitarum]|uniref:Uncharacterized protein n=1 Tax=Choanephora cucurbitarum TaxID=101091 RepID=A0A1C7M2F7_9FUNG|nr:hypothetical protein A0J61_11889 [Choanephora cucurbitarum]